MPVFSFTLAAIPAFAPVALIIAILGGIAWSKYGNW